MIPEGWDASDPPGRRRGDVPQTEQTASVAATIYNLWRGKLLRSAIDATLAEFGLGVGVGDFYAYRLIEALGYDMEDGVIRTSFVHYTSSDEVSRLITSLDELL